MSRQTLESEIATLLEEAAAARRLAATFSNEAVIRDLLAYATALEADASRMGEESTVEAEG